MQLMSTNKSVISPVQKVVDKVKEKARASQNENILEKQKQFIDSRVPLDGDFSEEEDLNCENSSPLDRNSNSFGSDVTKIPEDDMEFENHYSNLDTVDLDLKPYTNQCQIPEKYGTIEKPKIRSIITIDKDNTNFLQNKILERNVPRESHRASYERFIQSEENKIHLGLNYFIHEDLWDVMKRKDDSKFIRDLSLIFWGNEKLKYKCLDKARLRGTAHGSNERQELTPEKFKLLEDLLYEKLKSNKITGVKRQTRMRLIGTHISAKIRDVRRLLKL
ncbi:uncharacterized protein LOC122498330 [Leptopilina heterotoma]|uniref:uncharacterized protein LOC122498330 n=1 Tax=Leptopilina heterotoma TaxID=63436 RepID=UPI001CA89531|nr:uncharacterized protein LOC122498330 [Leptopilina heterotoma]